MSTSNQNTIATENAFELLKRMYENEYTADLTFVFRDENPIIKIKAHKCVLAGASKVFDRMFYGEFKENGDIDIVDVSSNAFQDFLRMIYMLEVDSLINFDNLAEMVYLSDKYDAIGCMKICMEFMESELKSNNVCKVLEIAIRYDLEELRGRSEIIVRDTWKVVIHSDAFLECSRDVLLQVLLMIESDEPDDCCLYEKCMEWAKIGCERNGIDATLPANWRVELDECYDLLNFKLLDVETFLKFERIYPIFTLSEFREIINHIVVG